MENDPTNNQESAKRTELLRYAELMGDFYAGRNLANSFSEIGDKCLTVVEFLESLSREKVTQSTSVPKEQIPESVLTLEFPKEMRLFGSRSDIDELLERQKSNVTQGSSHGDEQISLLETQVGESFGLGVTNVKHSLDYSFRTGVSTLQTFAKELQLLREGKSDELSISQLMAVASVARQFYSIAVARYVSFVGKIEDGLLVDQLPNMGALNTELMSRGLTAKIINKISSAFAYDTARGQVEQFDGVFGSPELRVSGEISFEQLGLDNDTNLRVFMALISKILTDGFIATAGSVESIDHDLTVDISYTDGLRIKFSGYGTMDDIEQLKVLVGRLSNWSLESRNENQTFNLTLLKNR